MFVFDVCVIPKLSCGFEWCGLADSRLTKRFLLCFKQNKQSAKTEHLKATKSLKHTRDPFPVCVCYVHDVHNVQNPQTHTAPADIMLPRGRTHHNSPCQSALWVSKSICVHDRSEVRARCLLAALMRWKRLKQETRTEELSYFGHDGSFSHCPPKLRSIIRAIKAAEKHQSAHLDSSEWVD